MNNPTGYNLVRFRHWATGIILAAVTLFLVSIHPACGQYVGVTCGFNYNNELTGPYPACTNMPLYNPVSSNPDATWADWAAQLKQAGVDYVCPNLRGSYPEAGLNPTNIAPFVTALDNLGNVTKLAIFDDNASSWTAEWNAANGFGFDSTEKFDMADTNNWKYIYDYNYKLFYQTVPYTNLFLIQGRPLLIIWTGNENAFLTNMQGNVSRAMTYVRQRCQTDFGFNPFIVLSSDFLSNDTTLTNAGVTDGREGWFTPPNTPYTLLTYTNTGVTVGALCPQFHDAGFPAFIDPDHGLTLDNDLTNTVNAGALVTLCEGFTDFSEDAALFRVRNLDASGNPLSYTQNYYDFPNQRLGILRKHSNWPFPPELTFEAEACDNFGGAVGGNGQTNFFRNGNIAIETSGDVGGGWDIGWIQSGEWLEWEQVPLQGSQVYLQIRVASFTNGCQLHFVIDGNSYPEVAIPNTGGGQNWTTVQTGPYQFAKGSYHTMRLVCDTAGFNVNYWRYHDEIPFGVNVALKAQNNGKYVSTGTNLTATSTSVGLQNLFTVVDASSDYGYGHVALEAVTNGLYVTAYTNGASYLNADAAAVGQAQVFKWTDNGDGTINLGSLVNSKIVSASNSLATFPLTINRFRAPGIPETFTVVPISTNVLSFVQPPNSTTAGMPITAGGLSEVQVLAVDASNNPIAGANITINIDSGLGDINENVAVTDANGIAHFTNLQIDTAGTKTLQASSVALAPATSASFNIIAGAPVALTVETQPDGSGLIQSAQNIVAGNTVGVYSVARDAFGNYVTNLPAAWSLAGITGGVVAGDLFVSNNGTSAIFTGHLKGSAIIRAAATFTGQSGVQTVIAGAASNLEITQQPSALAKAGLAFAQQPEILESDAFGNPSTTPITATETGGIGYLNFQPNGVTITPVNGMGAFSGLFVTNLGISSLTFSAGNISVQSSNILAGIGNAQQLSWTTQPGNAASGLNFGTHPVIQTVDAGGNVTTSGLPAVKLVAVSINSGSGSLMGTMVGNIGTNGGFGTLSLSNLSINATGTFSLLAEDIGNGYNPTNITGAPNCQLWFDAADLSTLALSGTNVSVWNDKSGHVNNGIGQASWATNSLLNSASPGRGRTVAFNGSQQLALNLSSLTNSPYTVLVMEVSGAKTSGSSSTFIGNFGGYSTDLTLSMGYSSASQFRWQHYADDLNYNNSALTNIVPRQWTLNLTAAPMKFLYLNSALVGTASSKYLAGTNLVNGSVGYETYLGNIAELIVYNSSLSINDQTNLQNYLQNKWVSGLSPATTQPFQVVTPVYNPLFTGATESELNGAAATVTLSGNNGPPDGSFRILCSTNLTALPTLWIPVLTNSFNATGAFNVAIPVNPQSQNLFYRLVFP